MTTSPTPEPSNQPQPEGYTTRLHIRTALFPGILLLIVLGGIAVVAFLFVTGFIVLRPNANSPEGKILAQKEMAERNIEFAHRADSARNTVSWDNAQTRLIAAQGFHRRLLEGHSRLDKEFKRLADGTEGKRIASREPWVDQFMVLHDRERLSDDEIANKLRAIQTLLPVCQQALKEKIVIPCDDSFLAQVDEIHDTLGLATQEVDSDLRSL